MHAVLERGVVTCTLAEGPLQKLRLANNFAFACATPTNCAMNATMLAELKKRQSSESAEEPEPAPRLSSAAYAAAPGFTPCRNSSAGFTTCASSTTSTPTPTASSGLVTQRLLHHHLLAGGRLGPPSRLQKIQQMLTELQTAISRVLNELERF